MSQFALARDEDISHHRTFSSSSQRPTIPPFWIPDYLKDSRYARKLQDVYEARVHTLRDQQPTPARIAPSHRGMTYDIIESNPPAEDEVIPLPSRLSSTDRHSGLELLGDGCEVKFQGTMGKELEAASIRSDYPISPQVGIYYYEIHIKHKSKDCAVAIGFAGAAASLERLPGWEPNSYAYHGDDGKIFEGQSNGSVYRPGFGQHDTIGCGIDFSKKIAWFTKNGHDLQVAFRNLNFNAPVYPCIGMKKQPGVQIEVNFGQSPFVFDIINKIAVEQDKVELEIQGTSTNRLHRDFPNETNYMQELVAQFLTHGGYIESALAFQDQVHTERAMLLEEGSEVTELYNTDVEDAQPRQEIRQAVLKGEIEKALELIEEKFPAVLPANALIMFHLKCRKFLELVLQAAEVNKVKQSKKGESQSTDDYDQEMDLDEDQDTSASESGKDPEDQSSTTSDEYNAINNEAILYGQDLKQEYGDSTAEQKQYLDDIFSLIGYPDPVKSPNGHLLDASGRTKVAEDLNSAILGEFAVGLMICADWNSFDWKST